MYLTLLYIIMEKIDLKNGKQQQQQQQQKKEKLFNLLTPYYHHHWIWLIEQKKNILNSMIFAY